MTVVEARYVPTIVRSDRYHLLNVGRNHKTVKGDIQGEWLTGIMYLAPNTVSGYNVCPASTEGCRKSCLFLAGYGGFEHVRNARIHKTRWLFEDQEDFMQVLVSDIQQLKSDAFAMGRKPAVRLNGTSDVMWETIPVAFGQTIYPNIMAVFPDLIFYDYTKIPSRKNLPKNYRLTFSLSDRNEQTAKLAFKRGMNVAVVFRKVVPATFWERQVINGDKDDLRFLDPHGVIVGLKAKGLPAYKDNSGFVQ